MQNTDKNIIWHKSRIVVGDNPLMQSFFNSVTELIGQKHSPGLPSSSAVAMEEIVLPQILTSDKLLFFLLNYPQAQVRSLLKRNIKEILHLLNQNLPAGIICSPLFYPEITGNSGTSEEEYQIRNFDTESMLKLSEAILLYNAYTDDHDFLTSDSFNMLLKISRFWASFLNNTYSSSLWLAEKKSLDHLKIIAAETLQFTLDFMGYLKAESSWLYEDLREQNKFSEIKETTFWKKIILKERSDIEKTNDLTSFSDIKNKLVKRNDFTDYIYNLAHQDTTKPNGLIIDNNILSSLWLNIVFHCYNLNIIEKKLTLTPSLPIDWELCSLVLHYRNSYFEVESTIEKIKVTNLSAIPVDIIISGEEIRVSGFSKQILTI